MDTIVRIRQNLLKNTDFTFEYYNYIFNACFISMIGLITNSSTTIIASMVISPIMNYVLALTMGLFINDKMMISSGLRGIIFSLFICIIVGSSGGLFFSNTLVLTNEILQRTDIRNVYWGILTATFSGLATASSLVANTNNNLIGIAISTSILPPAVNFGLLIPNSLWNLHNSVRLHQAGISLLITMSNILCLIISINFLLWIYSRNIFKTSEWITQAPSIRTLDLHVSEKPNETDVE